MKGTGPSHREQVMPVTVQTRERHTSHTPCCHHPARFEVSALDAARATWVPIDYSCRCGRLYWARPQPGGLTMTFELRPPTPGMLVAQAATMTKRMRAHTAP